MYSDFFADPDIQRTRSNVMEKAPKIRHTLKESDESESSSADEFPLEREEDLSEDEWDDQVDQDLESKFNQNLFDDANDAEDVQTQSRFEKAQTQMKRTIEELEKEAVADKHWALQGEVTNRARPLNSLLEEDIEVEHVAKPIPVVTEESTMTLEDLIKQRIKDNLFNDVERKVDPRSLLQAKSSFDPNRNEALDEKPQQSLAQVYESEYLKQLSGNRQTEKDEKLKAQHAEIDGLFRELCNDLDTLSNWHFTPKAPKLEMTVQSSSAPAIEMEEVVPLAVSDAMLVAPEEVYQKPRTDKDLKTTNEMESGEKKRVRARNKRKARADKDAREEQRELLAKSDPVLAARLQKKKSVKDSKQDAVDSLMRMGNVTVIGKQADGKKRKMGARVIAAGSSAKKARIEVDPMHLKL
jgi:U3 small nucleolar RNA-associated protein MPP10